MRDHRLSNLTRSTILTGGTFDLTCENLPAVTYRIVSTLGSLLQVEFTNPSDLLPYGIDPNAPLGTEECTVEIQISLNTTSSGSRTDWKFFGSVESVLQLITIPLPSSYGDIAFRYYICCDQCNTVLPSPPPPPPTPGPCTIAPCDSDLPCPTDPPGCIDSLLSFTDVYKEPQDILNLAPLNPIWVPKEFKITVSQTNCDATARIESNPCRIPDRGNNCIANFMPQIDILTLPILANSACYSCSRPIDIDTQCATVGYVPPAPDGSAPRNTGGPPRFYAPDYTIFKLLWLVQSQPPIAHPSIDCHVYDVDNVPAGTWILVHTTSTDSEMRQWVCEHFRFHCMINGIPSGGWPYNDLYWTAWDEVSPTLEQNTVYINLIPC